MTDPAIFEDVFAMQKSDGGSSLEEQLSGYLDRVEFTLFRQVSSRADRFFEASANQENIRMSVQVACDQVATLRITMDRLRNGLADKTLDIVSLHRRQKRMAELYDLVTTIHHMKQSESAIEALVQSQDFENALDLMDQVESTYHKHLREIISMKSIENKLKGYRSFITTQLSQQFLSTVTSPDWILPDKSVNMMTKFDASFKTASDTLTATIRRSAEGLFRMNGIVEVIAQYREQLNDEIKVVIKTVVSETIATSLISMSSSDAGTHLATPSNTESKISVQLRGLSSDEFLKCVQMIFEHLTLIIKRAVAVQELLEEAMQRKSGKPLIPKTEPSEGLEVSSVAIGRDETSSEGNWKDKNLVSKVLREIDDAIRKTCEFSQRSVSNLFSVRKEVQATYSMPQLRLLYDVTMDFVQNLEKMASKSDYTLRGALFSQLKLYLEKYHQVKVSKLISTIDHELWKNTEISASRHKALEDLSSGRGVSLILWEDRAICGDTTAPLKSVSICGKSFKVVWSVLLMLEIVMNYMSCAANFPVLATDVLQRSVEIIRLFNSRTTQLVLGAGAMHIARLKSISARHLGIASQSLELVITLLPHIKAALAAHFTDRQRSLLEEFDRVLRDYTEHNEKIFNKFTIIVEEQIMNRYLEHVENELNYDQEHFSLPSSPMKGVAQSTLKLYQILSPVLPAPQMKDLMTRVFDLFSQKLPGCFKHVQPKTEAGKKRLREDIALFVGSFGDVTLVKFEGEALIRHFAAIESL